MINLTWNEVGGEPGNARVLRFEGEATVEHARKNKEALQEGLENFDLLQLDCSGVSTLDFFAVQLFCSAHRTSIAANKRLGFVGAASPAVEEAMVRVGFARHRGCSNCPDHELCLWA